VHSYRETRDVDYKSFLGDEPGNVGGGSTFDRGYKTRLTKNKSSSVLKKTGGH